MYKHILVPLDGSKLAEEALLHAETLAKAFESRVDLIFVVEPVSIYPQPGMIGPIVAISMDTEEEQERTKEYLENVRRRLEFDGIDAGITVETGDPASEICDYSDKQKVDLIVMSTHGRSGIQRWVYGSVADRVLRGARVPILLIRSKPEET